MKNVSSLKLEINLYKSKLKVDINTVVCGFVSVRNMSNACHKIDCELHDIDNNSKWIHCFNKRVLYQK